MPQPAGTTPNPLPPDDNQGPALLILTGVLMGLAIVMTCVRCWVRRANRQLGLDDCLLVAATALATARMIIQILSVRKGNGRHVWYLTQEEYEWVVMSDCYTQLLIYPSLCLLKMSICILLLRTFSVAVVKWWLYALMAGLIITNLEIFIVMLAECRPIRATWNSGVGKCWSFNIRIYSIWVQGAYSIFSDLVCSLLPVIVILKLRMVLRIKLLLCVLMSMGLVATGCATGRIASLTLSTVDLSRTYCTVAIWSNAELSIGIIAANAACGRSIYGYFRNGCAVGRPGHEGDSGLRSIHPSPQLPEMLEDE